MSDAAVLDLARQALTISAKLALPILLVALVIGTVISLLQAVTQVQEMTLTFVPKVVAIAGVLLLGGGWMLNQLVEFTDSNPQYREQIQQHIVVLYPEPTTWSEHPVLALNANGKKLLDALHDDEELRKIAVESHGFRSALSGVTGNAVAVDSTVPMPGEAISIESGLRRAASMKISIWARTAG